MKKSDLPDKRKTASGNLAQSQMLTLPNLAYVLGEMQIQIRFNMMSNAPVFVSDAIDESDLSQSTAYAVIQDTLLKLDITNLSRFDELVTVLARQDSYHPMADWVAGVEWDGVDRIDALAATITTDNALWPVYLENWLVQVMEGVCGWRRTEPFSLPHVLVLVGGQGLGKSRWLSNVGSGWMRGEAELHLSSPSGKDHQLAVLKQPMAELAELDGIFRKSDISHMKSFISRETDEIRAPYAKRAVIRPRMTVFCGSVNDAEFLNDATGSRRFWPVTVTGISWSFSMDWAQLWAQAYAFWQEDAGFDLTAVEDAERARVALEFHTMITPEAEKIAAYYTAHEGNPRFPAVAMNRTEILEMLYGKTRSFSNKQTADAGRILITLVGRHRLIDKKQRAWMFPYNEFGADSAMWPAPILIKIVPDQ